MSTKTYSVLKALFFPLLNKLEMDYWCTHCGVDGYLYLLFQRRFFTLTKYMVFISFASQFVLWLVDPDFEFSIFGDNRMQETKSELSSAKAWVSICIIFIFTMLTIRIVQKTRRDAKVALESYYQDMSKYKDQECLKARTIHIKGVLPQDRTGEGIELYLNKILKSKSFGHQFPGKVLSTLIIPDFKK